MMIYIIREGMKLDEAIFADTGNELPETYSYIKVARKYMEDFGIHLTTVRVRNNDTLLDRCKRRGVIPSQVWRWCTRDFKIRPIYAYYRNLNANIYQYLGIDYGEAHRMKDSHADFVTNLYPLIDAKMNRADCVKIIEDEGLPVPPKSGCYFCPFNSENRWSDLLESHPRLFARSITLEESSRHFPNQKLNSLPLRVLKVKMRSGMDTEQTHSNDLCDGHCML
ncbi:MAG: hypothetical protein JRN15_15680 [Nitrososphaerota archaeon]|nr:hypothetical protein [Nitrososphaerota archaeon]